MPRLSTFRNALAAITMAVAALCGGGKAVAEQKGTLSVSEVRAAPALRSKSQRRADDVVAVVSIVEATANDHQEAARASGDDRAAPNLQRFVVSLSGAAPDNLDLCDQFRPETALHRPPTRAPPKGTASWLAVGSGRA